MHAVQDTATRTLYLACMARMSATSWCSSRQVQRYHTDLLICGSETCCAARRESSRQDGYEMRSLLCGRKEPAIRAEGRGYGGPGRRVEVAVGC